MMNDDNIMNMMPVNRLGVLGGTFNPLHIGHLILAQDAAELLDLGRLLFIPCAYPPHKPSPDLAPAKYRIGMLQAAIEGELHFAVSDIEVRRKGASYAIDTVRELAALYPRSEICFIIGSDSLPELHLWKDIDEILTLCQFKVFERPGYPLDSFTTSDLKLNAPWPEILLKNAVKGHQIDISSSNIRHRIAEGMSIRYLVHPAVEMYITEHRLYTE